MPENESVAVATSEKPFLSLCMIVGNEAERIVRCISSLATSFDELSLARAVGSVAPDETIKLAEEWCAKNGKQFVWSEYVNAPHGEPLPHVDDFAKARNQSFAQAHGNWRWWADADDVASPQTDFAELRRICEKTAADCLHFQYEVPGTNKKPYRERAIREEVFLTGSQWVFPLHENLAVGPEWKVDHHASPIWLHAPEGKKVTSKDRNLKILGRKIGDTAATIFYTHQEWFNANSRENARHWGEIGLMFHDMPPPFRYQILLNLARLARSHQETLTRAGNAHAIMPHCREAHAVMALAYFQHGDFHGALSAAETLVRIPQTSRDRLPWTYEPKWYGWAGWDLLARAQRAMVMQKEAEESQAKVHGKTKYGFGQPTISLIHATRGRSQKAVDCRNLWLDMASDASRVEHIYAFDEDDKPTVAALSQFQHVVCKAPSNCVTAWNAGAQVAKGKLLVQLSDDWAPCYGWDTALLQVIEGAKKDVARDQVVVAVNDGHRTAEDPLMCMAIMSRARWLAQGREMFSAEYESMFSDNEFSHRAWRDGVVIDCRAPHQDLNGYICPAIVFQHLHPIFGHGQFDETYKRNNANERYKKGYETYRRRNPDAAIDQRQAAAILAAV